MPDLLDACLLHALQLHGRAPFTLIADVLGVSDQTVARRYNRLRSAGLLRVRGLLEPSTAGQTQWIVRIRSTPGNAETLAKSLARRADTSWISLTAAGTEIVCVVGAGGGLDHRLTLLDSLVPSMSVLAVDAHAVLHEYFGGRNSLITKNSPLTAAQIQALRPPPAQRARHIATGAGDSRLLQVLKHDGRATVTAIASTTGWSQSAVRRRITELLDARLLYYDVDFDPSLFDLRMRAVMWLRVGLDHLAAVGDALAEHPEVGYAAATTGATNVYCAVSCRSAEALYTYLTDRVAGLPGVQQLETTPLTHSLKTSSILTAF